jgi:hypothetical protein
MLDAEDRGDARRLSLLQGQWVHRFGVATLPVSSASAPVSVSPTVPVTPLSGDSDASVAAETETSVDESSAAASFLEIISGTSEEQLVDEEQPVTEEQPVIDEQPVVEKQPVEPWRPVPAPPLSTPRSLRRWLPAVESSFPKAS